MIWHDIIWYNLILYGIRCDKTNFSNALELNVLVMYYNKGAEVIELKLSPNYTTGVYPIDDDSGIFLPLAPSKHIPQPSNNTVNDADICPSLSSVQYLQNGGHLITDGCRSYISYHIISYHILSYHIISYHIISYHTGVAAT